tara:strand:- start:2025 stop:2219 length:195 start_codon:yes stop_codon:yes gene_type:complete
MGRLKETLLDVEPFTESNDPVEGAIMQELKSTIRSAVEHTSLSEDQLKTWLVQTADNIMRGRRE